MLDGLNEPQTEAVLHEDGPLLIFACAGSGKTRCLTRRIGHLVSVRGVSPDAILAVTFTNKAAGEMRERLTAALGEKAKRLVMGTFHSVCARFLRAQPEMSERTKAFVIYDDDERQSLLKGIIETKEEEAKARSLVLGVAVFDVDMVMSRIELNKREGKLPDDVHPNGDDPAEIIFKDIYAAYERKMRMLDAMDFGDLIYWGMRLAKSPDEAGQRLRATFRYVLTDEFQDTDVAQFQLLQALAPKNLCVVGDDDQAVFSFRGANSRLIREFKSFYPDAKVVLLEQNYRSTGAIVRAATSIMSKGENRIEKKMWTDNPDGVAVAVVVLSDEREEGRFVAHTIQSELARGKRPSDAAVLVRLHVMTRAVENELRVLDIKYKVVGGLKFFQRAIIKDAIAYLRLVLKPDSDIDLVRIVDTPPCGIGDGTVARLRRRAGHKETSLFRVLGEVSALPETRVKERAALSNLKTRIETMCAEAGGKSVAEALPLVLQNSGLSRWCDTQLNNYTHGSKPNPKRADEVEAKIDNLRELLTDAARWQERRSRGGNDVDIGSYLERVALLSSDETDNDSDAVTLSTIHAAKGLEWPLVFVVGCEEGVLPAYPDKKSVEELAEERRLAYVACSRAQERLWLTRAETRWSMGQTKRNGPSRFLSDLPDEVLDAAAD